MTTSGLEFALTGAVLHPAEARGISNAVVSSPVEVHVDDGVVLVIGADAQSAHAT